MSLSHQVSQQTRYEPTVRVTYRIAGFDRPNFVSDIADSVPQDDSFLIRTLAFEADGIQAMGVLTIQIQHGIQPMYNLTQRLRSVQGIAVCKNFMSDYSK
ncbi:hypothetical protein IC229_33300 [Spirosoma sp. BT702]|uniref:ACT domain-containing protein n=1 Tax=Spirosoma profusum TaxID=2771354 RepID=A0A927GAL9_9BACT|nr:hypothetical protein [Spirosoma profusum]MBD2705533.1 hypothetical protein [Spirosoma profusum]